MIALGVCMMHFSDITNATSDKICLKLVHIHIAAPEILDSNSKISNERFS